MGSSEAVETEGRRPGVDAMRLVAFVGVCLVHISRWRRPDAYATDLSDWITLACRFAVPFFFLAGGYFSVGRDRLRALGRLGVIFGVWVLIYVCLTPGGAGRLLNPRFDLLTLIDGGPGYHLWFLPAFAFGLACAWAVGGRPRRLAWSIAIGSWLLGWALASYGPGRIGPYAGRYLSAAAFVLAGALWRRDPISLGRPPLVLTGLIGLGLTLEVIEAGLLSEWRIRPVGELEFGIGVGPLGVGAFLAALAWLPVSSSALLVARIGRRALGLYAVHLGVAMLLFAVLPFAVLWERIAVCVLTILGSIACVEVLRRTPLRRLVQ